MSQHPVYPVPEHFKRHAAIDEERYQALYQQSVDDPDTFWAEQAETFLTWDRKWDRVCESDLHQGKVAWFQGGKLNVSVNCIDRHLPERADQVAIIWEGDDPSEDQLITYRQLHLEVCRLANLLRERGVKKGDRVCLYLPMIPEAAYAMLACARIGAVHSVVFGGFSPDALANRINDCQAKAVITADTAPRGGRRTALKSNTDKALLDCSEKVKCFVVKHTGDQTTWIEGR